MSCFLPFLCHWIVLFLSLWIHFRSIEVVATDACENFVFSSDQVLKTDPNHFLSCVFLTWLSWQKRVFARIIRIIKNLLKKIFYRVWNAQCFSLSWKQNIFTWVKSTLLFSQMEKKEFGKIILAKLSSPTGSQVINSVAIETSAEM